MAEVMVGSVFVHTTMSLDGFIAGPNDEMGWVFRHVEDVPSSLVDEVIARTGRSWAVGADFIDEPRLETSTSRPPAAADGVRLFGVPQVRAALETLDVSVSGQVVNLRFRVNK